MGRKKIRILSVGVLFVGGTLFLIGFEVGGSNPASAQATDHIVFMSGEGNFTNQVIRCRTALLSDCGDDDPSTVIERTVRETTLNECDGVPGANNPPGDEFVQYSGMISNEKVNGHQVTHSIREFCAPDQPSRIRFTTIHTLENATVTDPETSETRIGDIEIVTHGIAVGDVVIGDPTKFVETRGPISIRGTSGELAGLRGNGFVEGFANFQGSSNAYTAEIRLPN